MQLARSNGCKIFTQVVGIWALVGQRVAAVSRGSVMSEMFSPEEYQARWSKIHDDMAVRGYEAALIFGKGGGSYDRCGDVLYLSNYYSCASG
jgi:hypothetical protein